MLEIIFAPQVEQRLKALLSEQEDSEPAFFRICEIKVGSTWYAHTELRLMLDTKGPLPNDICGNFREIPFVLHPDMVDYYGKCYEIMLDSSGAFTILAHERMEFLLLSR